MNKISLFELVAILLVLTAAFGWINHRMAILPHTVGLLVMGLGTSLVIIGTGLWAVAGVLGIAMPRTWALVFGALIRPTDRVAVLATLNEVKVPPDLQIVMTGGTLFNDGVGVVLFAVLLQAARGESVGVLQIGEMFLIEALGGAILGAFTGYIAYRAMRAIDDYYQSADLVGAGRRNLCDSRQTWAKWPVGRCRRGSSAGQPGSARCAQRSDPTLSIWFPDVDRRNAEFGPIPVDRAGDSGPAGCGAAFRWRWCWRYQRSRRNQKSLPQHMLSSSLP